MRLLCVVLVCFYSFSVGGCLIPGFQTSPAYHMPISEVVNQIKCDMYGFFREHYAKADRTFTLDRGGYSTVELNLTTTVFGDVKFSKIDSKRLGVDEFIATGSSSQPFPSLGTKGVGQTVAKVQVNISQNPEDLEDNCTYGSVLDRDAHSDQTLVNRLRVREWLIKSFADGDRIKRDGPACNAVGKRDASKGISSCEASLETVTLTTKFQLVVRYVCRVPRPWKSHSRRRSADFQLEYRLFAPNNDYLPWEQRRGGDELGRR